METPKATPIQPDAMDVDEGASTSKATTSTAPVAPPKKKEHKRKNVDEDGHEVPDSKRNRAVPEAADKMNVYMLVLHWHEYLFNVFEMTQRAHIDNIADLTSICQTIHNKFRQDCNGVGKLKDAIGDDYKFTAFGKQTTYKDIHKHMKELATLYGFHYGNSEADRKLNGTLSSLLVLLTSYRPRFSEVRLGNATITLRKQDGQDYEMELSRFNLTNVHSVLLSGCRFTPSLQSCMKQSLGPMTIALNLCMNTEKRYQDSWMKVFCQVFKLIPGIEDIAKMLAGSRCRYGTILRQLADIALFGVTRSSNKAFIPMACIMAYQYKHNGLYRTKFTPYHEDLNAITLDMIQPNLRTIDASGKGLLAFWNGLTNMEFFIHGDPAILTPVFAEQIVFHAVFGTHKENLELLKWMTGVDFYTRREMKECFKERATSGKTVKFTMIPFIRFAKLVNAAQTSLLRGGVGQIARCPTFSGKFSETLDQDAELFKILQTTENTVSVGGLVTEGSLITKLHAVKQSIETQLRQQGKIDFGTVSFKLPSADGLGGEYGADVAGPGQLGRRYFYQQE